MTSPRPDLVALESADLTTVNGGMQWQNFCASYNVEDRRPGAGTKLQQRARIDQWNAERGCPVWADLHPKQR
ncbi:hypothetical protein BH11MYX1_BH11MYX1_21540 [soil metagenome]